VQGNNLSGSIPSTLHTLTGLTRLLLDHNNFDGSIPINFEEMTSLLEFRAYDTDLTGSLPQGVCDLKKAHDLEFIALDCDKVNCDCCDQCL